MRRHYKKILIDLTETLSEAHKDIGQRIRQGEMDAASAMLGRCQETAISIGETICSVRCKRLCIRNNIIVWEKQALRGDNEKDT